MASIAVATVHACALGKQGSVWCWGSFPAVGYPTEESCDDLSAGPAHGPSKTGPPANLCSRRPRAVPIEGVVEIATGSSVSCARHEQGTVTCWGLKGKRSLGWTGEGPSQVLASESRPVPGVEKARHVAVGYAFACAVVDDGAVTCWGRNDGAQLGRGSFENPAESYPPAEVAELRGVEQLTLDHATACALLSDKTVTCWGSGAVGPGSDRCGESAAANPCKLRPAPVEGLTDIVQIDTNGLWTCALRGDGAIFCWDRAPLTPQPDYAPNSRGPRRMEGLPTARQISVPLSGLCLLTEQGQVQCLGLNVQGQLGRGQAGETKPSPAPVQGLADVVQISSGNFTTCALRQDGSVYCWGSNRSGQIGDGTIEPRATPVKLEF